MEDKRAGTRLQRLEESDFEIANKEPDITGWDVVDENCNKLAVISDLLFDSETSKVVYMEVWTKKSDDDIITVPSLIPIGLAELDKDKDEVIIPGLTKERLRALPVYDRDEITPAYEQQIRKAFQQPTDKVPTEAETDFYQNAQFNNEHLFDRRRNLGATNNGAAESAGEKNISEVEIHKYIVSFYKDKELQPKKSWKPNKDDLFLID